MKWPLSERRMAGRRHVLSIDDGPFRKFEDRDVLLVGVVTAGRDLVEGVITTRAPVDGPDVAALLADWINGSRFRPVIRAVLLNGITIAGLSVVDLAELSRRSGLPALAVHRRPPRDEEIVRALQAAGLADRIPLLERAGPSHPAGAGPSHAAGAGQGAGRLHFSASGIEPDAARELLKLEEGRSHLPEGLRLAHLIAQGIVLGESKGGA